MLFGDKEEDLIRNLQLMVTIEEILFLPKPSKKMVKVFKLIADEDKWKDWIDSSGKGDPPPDFYSDKHHIMMDVMRVDDHERKGKKGKLYNPLKQHEREIYKKFGQDGIIEHYPNADFIINGVTGLPTHEDHSYTFYLKNFKRVLQKHIDSISLYKKNHPGYKIVFFVHDESSQYMQTVKKIEHPKVGESTWAMPHFWWMDEEFIKAFRNSGIDYVIWFTPYKHCEMYDQHGTPVSMPMITIIDTEQQIETHKYNKDFMESVEI